MSAVDVIDAAINKVRQHAWPQTMDLEEARAAVAELIEADRGYDEAIAECDGSAESLDRHDVAHERRSLAIARLTGASP